MEYPIDFMKTRCNPFGISTQHQSISINTNPCHTCHIYIYHTYNVVHPTTNLPFRDGFYNTHLYPFMLIFWMVFGWFPSANLTQLLKMDHLQLIYLLKMVIFHSYVSLPEGISTLILGFTTDNTRSPERTRSALRQPSLEEDLKKVHLMDVSCRKIWIFIVFLCCICVYMYRY